MQYLIIGTCLLSLFALVFCIWHSAKYADGGPNFPSVCCIMVLVASVFTLFNSSVRESWSQVPKDICAIGKSDDRLTIDCGSEYGDSILVTKEHKSWVQIDKQDYVWSHRQWNSLGYHWNDISVEKK